MYVTVTVAVALAETKLHDDDVSALRRLSSHSHCQSLMNGHRLYTGCVLVSRSPMINDAFSVPDV